MIKIILLIIYMYLINNSYSHANFLDFKSEIIEKFCSSKKSNISCLYTCNCFWCPSLNLCKFNILNYSCSDGWEIPLLYGNESICFDKKRLFFTLIFPLILCCLYIFSYFFISTLIDIHCE